MPLSFGVTMHIAKHTNGRWVTPWGTPVKIKLNTATFSVGFDYIEGKALHIVTKDDVHCTVLTDAQDYITEIVQTNANTTPTSVGEEVELTKFEFDLDETWAMFFRHEFAGRGWSTEVGMFTRYLSTWYLANIPTPNNIPTAWIDPEGNRA